MKKKKKEVEKRTDMKYWTGGKIIIDAIRKNVKISKDEKYIIWRPRNFENI